MSNHKRSAPDKTEIAQYIDHTLLGADSTRDDIKKICQEAREWSPSSICIPPKYVQMCSDILESSSVDVGTVIGFPLGYNKNMVKIHEALNAFEDGADELDVVMNIGMFKQGNRKQVLDNLNKIVSVGVETTFKIIIETALLSREEIKEACQLVSETKADFVKTSTGFASEGATVQNVELMKQTVQDNLKIKAAGGISTLKQAQRMIEAGADRIGTSSTAQILGKKG